MPISWTLRKQTAIQPSKTEAEYRAMAEVIQRSIYAKALSVTFDKQGVGIKIGNEKMNALDMLKALGATKISKFIDMRHQYLKQTIKNNNLKLVPTPQAELKAVIFKKALERRRFEKRRQMI